MPRRFLVGAAVAAALALAVAPVVSAAPSVRWTGPWSTSVVVTDECAFPFMVDVEQWGAEVDRFDGEGNWIGALGRVKEHDTFSANGHVLVGEPYTFTYNLKFDANGNIASFTFHGLVQKIRLADGTLFIAAGWAPFTGDDFILTPERGSSPDIDAFCSALS